MRACYLRVRAIYANVMLQDAVVSVICVETSLHSTAQLGVDSVLHSDFPPNPDEGSVLNG